MAAHERQSDAMNHSQRSFEVWCEREALKRSPRINVHVSIFERETQRAISSLNSRWLELHTVHVLPSLHRRGEHVVLWDVCTRAGCQHAGHLPDGAAWGAQLASSDDASSVAFRAMEFSQRLHDDDSDSLEIISEIVVALRQSYVNRSLSGGAALVSSFKHEGDPRIWLPTSASSG